MKKAFTLIELLAVIVLLAIVLLIAIPTITKIIISYKKEAFKNNAALILKTVDLKKVEYPPFEVSTISAENVTEVLNINADNYESLQIIENEDGSYNIEAVGKNAWSGLEVNGNNKNLIVTVIEEENEEIINNNADETGASTPKLSSNMIPIYYDEVNKIWKKADENNELGENQWYDYNAKKWANAVVVSEENRDYYINAIQSTPIIDSGVWIYFVWIPRYKYYITSSGTLTPSEIQIQFEEINTEKSLGNAITEYRTHPAFTFDNQELSGIWFAKFETTGTIDSLTSKMNLVPITSKKISIFFEAIKNMKIVDNIYGYGTDEVDTHMAKNSEWGAVAYLSHSKYGFNEEVWINPDSSNRTGYAGTKVDCSKQYNLNVNNSYSGIYGMKASTTGNTYGIYDMSGGFKEFVMTNNNDVLSGSGFLELPEIKYYNKFTGVIPSTACDGGICYGQAMSETAGWYNDFRNFLFSGSFSFLTRGESSTEENKAGIFAGRYEPGSSSSTISTRIVQVTFE